MKLSAFLDTNVFIYAFEFKNSNSKIVIDLLNEEIFGAIISEQVIKEVAKYFRKYYTKELAEDFTRYLIQSCKIVFRDEVVDEINKLSTEIKFKDIEQLATVRKFGIKYLVAYDRDFEGFEEYTTPKRFIEILGDRAKETDY